MSNLRTRNTSERRYLHPSLHYVPPFPWDLDMLPYVTMADHASLPLCRGIYFFRTSDEVLYIGATKHLAKRLAHHQHLHFLQAVTVPISIAWLPFPHATDKVLLALEQQAITYYKPLLNGHGLFFLTRTPPEKHMFIKRSLEKAEQLLKHLTHPIPHEEAAHV